MIAEEKRWSRVTRMICNERARIFWMDSLYTLVVACSMIDKVDDNNIEADCLNWEAVGYGNIDT